MRRITWLLLLAVVACGAPDRPSIGGRDRPNVLIVVTDDERFGSQEATPKLYDWFRSDGTIYRRAYVTTPHCCPSRASIFSGRYVHNHGVWHERKVGQFDHGKTMQRELRDAGYMTGFVGKFINGWNPTRPPPSFDAWTVGTGYESTYVVDGAPRHVTYGPRFVFDQARRYINDWELKDDEPWALMVSPFAPHEPFQPEQRFASDIYPWDGDPATRETDLSDKPPYVRELHHSAGLGAEHRQAQFRTLRTVDNSFMQMLRVLDERQELDNTVVIYTSDNGYMWGEHGLITKGFPYDGAVRVPMYARGPGIGRGTNDELVANIDIAPTVYDLVGIEPGYEVDGRSMLSSKRDSLLLEYEGGKVVPQWATLVTPRSTYTEYADGFREFYDLNVDRYQLENMPELATQQMRDELAKMRTCVGEACP